MCHLRTFIESIEYGKILEIKDDLHDRIPSLYVHKERKIHRVRQWNDGIDDKERCPTFNMRGMCKMTTCVPGTIIMTPSMSMTFFFQSEAKTKFLSQHGTFVMSKTMFMIIANQSDDMCLVLMLKNGQIGSLLTRDVEASEKV